MEFGMRVEDPEEDPVAGKPDSLDVWGRVMVLKRELTGPGLPGIGNSILKGENLSCLLVFEKTGEL